MFAYCILPLIESPSRAHGCLCCRAAGQAVPWLGRGPRCVMRHLGAGPQRAAVRALALPLQLLGACAGRARAPSAHGLYVLRGLRCCYLAWATALVSALPSPVRLPGLSLVPAIFSPDLLRAVRPSLLHARLWLYGCCRPLIVVKSDSPVTLPRLLMLLAVSCDEFTMYLLNPRASIQISNALMLD